MRVIRLGIIGCGNMGGAMLRQAVKAGLLKPDEILVSDKNPDILKKLAEELSVSVTRDNAAAAAAPCVLLAVKPQFVGEVGEEIAPHVKADALILSIVAGCDLKTLHGLLQNENAHIVRIMPNTPALVGEGVMAACPGERVTDEEWAFAARLLSCMGLVQEVPENLMDAVTGVSGSSPAFVFLFLEAHKIKPIFLHHKVTY